MKTSKGISSVKRNNNLRGENMKITLINSKPIPSHKPKYNNPSTIKQASS